MNFTREGDSLIIDEKDTFDPVIMDRLRDLMSEKYIHTPRNKQLWSYLLDLTFQKNKPKVMGCLLTGKPHSGKTTATHQFKKAYLDNVTNAEERDIVLFQIPSRARLKGVMVKLARQIGIPGIIENSKTTTTYDLIELVAAKLWNDRTKLLIIDEFQHLFELSGESRREILDGFNDLINESKIPIVLVGVDGVDRILDLDAKSDESNLKGTFCSRFPEIKLEPWNNPDEIAYIEFVYTVYADCYIQAIDNDKQFLDDYKTRERIIAMSDGLTGKIITLLKYTARNMIRGEIKGQMTRELLEVTFKQIQAKGW
jgi:GTPase SAR1 family protein